MGGAIIISLATGTGYLLGRSTGAVLGCVLSTLYIASAERRERQLKQQRLS